MSSKPRSHDRADLGAPTTAPATADARPARRSLMGWYERLLLIHPDVDAADLLRSRAIYIIGWAFIATQLLNLAGMTHSYGGWTYDHTIAVIAIAVVLGVIHSLRFCRNFTLYAVFLSVLIIGAVLGSALPESTGINSALLPYIIVGPFINGFVAGWRMSAAFSVVGFITLCGLYGVTVFYPSPLYEGLETASEQRFFQSVFGLLLAAPIAAVFSSNMFRAFALLEHRAAKAQAADKAKTAFLANMSHELRTPLSGVLGLSDSLKTTRLDPEQQQLVRAINESGKLLLKVLNDILDLSKINAGKLDLTPQPFAPRQLAHMAANTWRVAAEAKGLSFHASVDDDVPMMVVGDDRRLSQVVFNLLSNAVKFTREGAVSLHVEARPGATPQETMLLFHVHDTGVGVDDAVSERIYEAFEQGDVGVARQHGGTGLGLSVSRRLAALLGGDLSFRRKGPPPGGTVFTLRAPVFSTSLDVFEPEEEVDDAPAPSGLRILVVEDDRMNQFVIHEILKRWDVTFDIVEDGAACLERLGEAPFDLILMDKRMPVMDGVAATQRIRARRDALRDIPIIGVSAEALDTDYEAMIAAGMSDFIAKPVRPGDIKRAIHRVLSTPSTVDAAIR